MGTETKRNGRPSKISSEVVDRILDLIRHGNYLTVAAMTEGIHEATLRRWIARGNRLMDRIADGDLEPDDLDSTEALYVKLSEEFQVADAEGHARLVLLSSDGAAIAARKGNIGPAMTMLERKWPEHWSLQHRVAISVDPGEARTIRGIVDDILDDLDPEWDGRDTDPDDDI